MKDKLDISVWYFQGGGGKKNYPGLHISYSERGKQQLKSLITKVQAEKFTSKRSFKLSEIQEAKNWVSKIGEFVELDLIEIRIYKNLEQELGVSYDEEKLLIKLDTQTFTAVFEDLLGMDYDSSKNFKIGEKNFLFTVW